MSLLSTSAPRRGLRKRRHHFCETPVVTGEVPEIEVGRLLPYHFPTGPDPQGGYPAITSVPPRPHCPRPGSGPRGTTSSPTGTHETGVRPGGREGRFGPHQNRSRPPSLRSQVPPTGDVSVGIHGHSSVLSLGSPSGSPGRGQCSPSSVSRHQSRRPLQKHDLYRSSSETSHRSCVLPSRPSVAVPGLGPRYESRVRMVSGWPFPPPGPSVSRGRRNFRPSPRLWRGRTETSRTQ